MLGSLYSSMATTYSSLAPLSFPSSLALCSLSFPPFPVSFHSLSPCLSPYPSLPHACSTLSIYRVAHRPGDTLPMMGGAYTLLALVVVLLLTAAEFGFALYAFRSFPLLSVSLCRSPLFAVVSIAPLSKRFAHVILLLLTSMATHIPAPHHVHSSFSLPLSCAATSARPSRRESDITTCSKLCHWR
jgi:hypothetical protein